MSHKSEKEICQNLETLLTIKEVARFAKCSERHIQNQVRKGKFPQPIRLGRSVRFHPSEIQKVLNGEFSKGLRNQAI